MVELTVGLKAIGAGLAMLMGPGLSAIGQGHAAAAGIGAITEKEELFAKSFVLAAMTETQAIYCFVVAILILVL